MNVLSGALENWRLGDVFGCGQGMSRAMAEMMTQLDSARQIGLFKTSEAKLMVVGERVMRGI